MASEIFFPLIIIIILYLIHQTVSDPRADLLGKSCGQGHVDNIAKYIASYANILEPMKMDMRVNKFAVREEGVPPNRVYVLAQCMDDLSNNDCNVCFSKIVNELPSCLPSPGGRVYFDGCFMRVDNYSFFQEITSSVDMKRCSDTNERSDEYESTARLAINDTVNMAPENEGYADRRVTAHGMPVYAMANCWKTLDSTLCSHCLKRAVKSIHSCLPALEGRALNAGCFLRYSDYDFANKRRGFHNKGAVFLYLAYVLAAVGLCLLAILIGFFVGNIVYRRLNHLNNSAVGFEMVSPLLKRSLQFKYSTLEKATEDFIETNKIGQGGYGEVFKGNLLDGREIAIKRLFIGGKHRVQEVCNEMDIICQAQHKNLVRFLGCCFTNEDSFLVYEFLANKSLDLTLFDPEKKKELNWKKRLGILIGTAEGLEYLHRDCQVRIIHRDIKASNVLLDLKYRPKIADFGLARFYSNDKHASSTVIAGTLGYMAPEYLAQGRLTEKVDVYSYGVLVLETVSGMQNSTFQSEESLNTLVTTTWRHFKANTVSEIIDKSLKVEDVEEEEAEEEALRAVQIGLLCTQESPSLRPTMTAVIQMLTQRDLEVPTPTKPPFTDESLTVSCSLGYSRSNPSCCSRRDHSVSIDSSEYFDTGNGLR